MEYPLTSGCGTGFHLTVMEWLSLTTAVTFFGGNGLFSAHHENNLEKRRLSKNEQKLIKAVEPCTLISNEVTDDNLF